MNTINDRLEREGLLLKGGTLVDATLIHAAPSTKHQAKSRDPAKHQTKKGNQWYFGMKLHVGADVASGLAHTVSVTPANVADITECAWAWRISISSEGRYWRDGSHPSAEWGTPHKGSHYRGFMSHSPVFSTR